MKDKNIQKTQCIVLLLILLILLYLLIQNFGYIENGTTLVPTGNVDIFEIDCNCCNKGEEKTFKQDDDSTCNICKNKVSKKKTTKKSDVEENKLEDDEIEKEIDVFDNYKTWDNKELRIFSNPTYEYESKIAPGSSNSYTFVIRNNNDFDVVYDISFKEQNSKNINMKYKLTHNDSYLIGQENKYESIANKKITSVELPAKSQKAYILYWKWVDSNHDTQVGFDINSKYKLSIIVGVI